MPAGSRRCLRKQCRGRSLGGAIRFFVSLILFHAHHLLKRPYQRFEVMLIQCPSRLDLEGPTAAP